MAGTGEGGGHCATPAIRATLAGAVRCMGILSVVDRGGCGPISWGDEGIRGGGLCTGTSSDEKTSTRVCFACSPEFAVREG